MVQKVLQQQSINFVNQTSGTKIHVHALPVFLTELQSWCSAGSGALNALLGRKLVADCVLLVVDLCFLMVCYRFSLYLAPVGLLV